MYVFLKFENVVFFCFFAECTCNSLGIERSQCTAREDCVCQRSSGQCQCLPNVMGLSCDHCAPDHWNLAAGAGCEACGCDPNNSVTSSCNEVAAPHGPQPEIHPQVQEISLISSSFFFLRSVFSSLGSASVATALEGRRAQTVRRTTGETPGHSAEVRGKPTGIFKL